MKDDAAAWHEGMTDDEAAKLNTVEGWVTALRDEFPMNASVQRRLARDRRWEFTKELVGGYYHQKLKLLRQAFGYNQSEVFLVTEIKDGLPATLRENIRLPDQPTLRDLRKELNDREPTWREVHETTERRSTALAGRTATTVPARIAGASLVRSASAPGLPAQSAGPISSTPTPQGALSLSATYDPKRVTPAANGQARTYKRPDNDQVMVLNRPCHRCQGDHFTFEHQHVVPQVRHLVLDDDDYPVLEEEDSGEDFHSAPMLATATEKGKARAVDDSSHVSSSQSSTPPGSGLASSGYKTKSPQCTAKDVAPESVPRLHFADRSIFQQCRRMPLLETIAPLARATHRFGNVVPRPVASATGTGKGYQAHIPLTARIRINGTDSRALPSLIDTGASLSAIDEALLKKLGGRPHGKRMEVQGLGNKRTRGWVTITFFIDATDKLGAHTHLEFTHDFHVLPDFAPGLCLGNDFIGQNDLTISPVRGRARIGQYTFKVVERLDGPFAKDLQLIVSEDVVLEPGFQTWVPVGAASMIPDVDYVVSPRLSVSPDETVRLAGPTTVMRHGPQRHILLGHHGTQPFTIPKGMIIADASAARAGDVDARTSEVFTLRPPVPLTNPTSPAVSPDMQDSIPAEETLPLDAFEGTEPPGSALVREAETVMVDDVFRVGVQTDGTAHPSVCDLLRQHKSAFALDGRPGRVEGFDMGISDVPDAVLQPEAPRRASPEKRAAMDAAIDQLLDWDIIEPSQSSVSFPVLMVRQYGKWRFCVDYRQLNTQTVPDRYPLPTIDAMFQTLSGKKWFSALDAIRGYHQLGNQAVVYIDDSVVATDTLEEHVRALGVLLSSAEQVGLKFSPSKCTFAVPSLTLLGRKVSGAGIAIWADRAKAVQDLARPTTLHELYHVLGLFGYYRAFVHRFAEIAAPLTRLLKGWRYESHEGTTRLVNTEGKALVASRVPIEWGDAQQRSFEHLRDAIAHPPTLAHPDPAKPYLLYVDASKDAFAAILHQIHAQDLPPSSSDPPSASLQHIDRQAPPIDLAVGHLHHFDVQHLPFPLARDRWRTWLMADRYFAPLLRKLEQDSGSDDTWSLTDGLLVSKVDDRLALPLGAVPSVLRATHDNNGHFGFMKTYLALARFFWRPQLSVAVRAWVKHCPTCQHTKQVPKSGSLDISGDPFMPFEAISIDMMLGLPLSRAGNNAAVAILDVFSRMILLTPCSKDITAEGVVAIVSDRVLRMGWRPKRIITDSEAKMSGSVMQQLATSLGAKLTPSTPYHQQANSVERAIQTTQHVLQSLSVESKSHWDRRALPAAELAINSTPSLTSGYRPFDLVFIGHPSLVHALVDAGEHLGVDSFEERVAAANERIRDAQVAIKAARSKQKVRYDARRLALPPLQVGDRVFIRLRDRPIPGTVRDKLDPRKLGPYEVVEVLSPHRVRVRLPAEDGGDVVFNIEQLDVLPREEDPFVLERAASPAGPGAPLLIDDDVAEPPASPPSPVAEPPTTSLAPRPHRLPAALRDFPLGTLSAGRSVDSEDAFRDPLGRPRRMVIDGVEQLLVERPVAFLSRLTTVGESKLAASELELCCLTWGFAKLAHLLEGAQVTVITDHAPMEKMLRSTTATPYGPAISRCRAFIMPHLPNLRFLYRPGPRHVNVDALSRLPPADQGRSELDGGHVLDNPPQ
ncbi:hypothetical protein A4X09_0g7049 [Tilletia walkeri]|uniref:RNA-directed DNA polymerase n=1 Tax=Tilletia walkeri TaxID=117179 RepID=A0A8X7N2V3_9BASI|nr:hypothetical protein A4X09_0g7049 [Tilletia walkeri]